jgi:hypothetical protein
VSHGSDVRLIIFEKLIPRREEIFILRCLLKRGWKKKVNAIVIKTTDLKLECVRREGGLGYVEVTGYSMCRLCRWMMESVWQRYRSGP